MCNAHALRELQAVVDATASGQWCWAAQAADAQRDMKRLMDASLAITQENISSQPGKPM